MLQWWGVLALVVGCFNISGGMGGMTRLHLSGQCLKHYTSG